MKTLRLCKPDHSDQYEDQYGFHYSREEVGELIANGEVLVHLPEDELEEMYKEDHDLSYLNMFYEDT